MEKICVKEARNEGELKNLINEGFNIVNSSDYDGYYRKMIQYLNRCLNHKEINE